MPAPFHRLIFGSLNYDCLFEQAACALDYGVDYSCGSARTGEIRVAKIHGSCNFVTQALSQSDRALLSASNVAYEKAFDCLCPIGLEARLRPMLSGRETSYLPIMSQISPGKEHLIAPSKILQCRNAWKDHTLTAEAVVIIGVSHNQNDKIIQETVRALAVPIYYIGDDDNAVKWKDANSRVKKVDAGFEQGVEKLLDEVGLN